MPLYFYRYICTRNNFMILNERDTTYNKIKTIVHDYLIQVRNFAKLSFYFKQNWKIYQYFYNNLFPKFFINNDKRGMEIKGAFLYSYKEWVGQKTRYISNNLGKPRNDYNNRKEPEIKFEQKPVQSKDPSEILHEKPKKIKKWEQRILKNLLCYFLE